MPGLVMRLRQLPVTRHSLRMHAIGCLLSLLLLPVAALGDGRMIPSTAFTANITMPDQQALIHFTNGTERLVIETRFTGAGTNFAWVVPLPGQPIVEAATTGLFPTLRYLFQPRVIHNVPHYYIGILVVIGLILLLRAAFRAGVLAGTVAFLTIFLLGAMLLLPVLSTAGHRGMATTTEGAVSILDRRVVGVFDTTTIASQDPKALRDWLRENGFVASADIDPAIESYVKEGWVFVAAKVRRDLAELQTNTPHPLSFTFKTVRPVYPIRLTGINNGPLRVELYVFGPERASAPHFEVERCTQPAYPELDKEWARDFGRDSQYRPSAPSPMGWRLAGGNEAHGNADARRHAPGCVAGLGILLREKEPALQPGGSAGLCLELGGGSVRSGVTVLVACFAGP